jgi:hypothetical protein
VERNRPEAAVSAVACAAQGTVIRYRFFQGSRPRPRPITQCAGNEARQVPLRTVCGLYENRSACCSRPAQICQLPTTTSHSWTRSVSRRRLGLFATIEDCAWSLLLTFPRAALGANFSQFQERGATNIGNLRATSDTEMRKIGPSPSASTPARMCWGRTPPARKLITGSGGVSEL